MSKVFTYKIITWFVTSFGIGLTQIWFSLGNSFLDADEHADFYSYFLNGAFLFFCSGLVATSAYDLFSVTENTDDKYKFFLKNIIAPGAIIMLITFTYVTVSKTPKVNENNNIVLQVIVILLSLAYAIQAKITQNTIEDNTIVYDE